MDSTNISNIVSAYLQEYVNSKGDKYPNPSAEAIQVFRESPVDTFDVIDKSQFHKPENLDFRDLDDPIFRILVTFVDLIPDLLISKMTKGFWGTRYTYIQCAAATKSPAFIHPIVDLLTDRSIYIKTLVLELITMYPHLQIEETLPKFEKLKTMKTFQDSSMDKELLEKAIQCVSAK